MLNACILFKWPVNGSLLVIGIVSFFYRMVLSNQVHAFFAVACGWLAFIQSEMFFLFADRLTSQRHACTFEAFEQMKAFRYLLFKSDSPLLFHLHMQVSIKATKYVPLPVSSGKSKISAEHCWSCMDSDRHCHFLTVHQPCYRYYNLMVDVVVLPGVLLVLSFRLYLFIYFLVM